MVACSNHAGCAIFSPFLYYRTTVHTATYITVYTTLHTTTYTTVYTTQPAFTTLVDNVLNWLLTHQQLEESTMLLLFASRKKSTIMKNRRPNVLAALIVGGLLIGGSAAFADFDAAVRAQESGNYREAMAGLTTEAEKGNTEAQRRLGEMYRQGQGTIADPVQAIKWLTLAYVNGMRDETVDVLEMLRDSVSEEQVVEAEQAALQWLEETNRIVFSDDDTDSLYQNW